MCRKLCCLLLAGLLAGQCALSASAVSTSAVSAILLDGNSGRVLYAQNADEPRLIASITKIMTAVVALEKGELDQVCQVQPADQAEGSSMYLKAGERVTLEELLYGLMLPSGNDAALAIARCVSGSVEAFVAEMNGKAEELGMAHTSFANPNGLDAEDHYSTARDMAVLTAYAMNNPTFRRIVSTSSITIGERTLSNHNRLLKEYEGCIGVKTGYTKAAGRTLVSAAERDGQLLIAVTLSDGNDWQDHRDLLDYGFSAYPGTAVFSAGEQLGLVKIRGSDILQAPIVAAEGFSYPLAQGEAPEVTLACYGEITAPVPEGAVIGEAVIRLDGQEIGRVPVACGADVAVKMAWMEAE